ncbi:MAG: toxin-antitoxin system YwqK family antitoxin [Kiritimatiellia bacterium]
MRKTVLTVACLAMLVPAASLKAQSEEQGAEQVVTIKSIDDLPERCLRTQRNRQRCARVLKEPLENLPEGYLLKVTIGSFFDQGQTDATGLFEPYVVRYVPVDPEGKENGTGKSFSQRGRMVQETPWKDGGKHGTEVFYNEWPRYVTAKIPWENGVIQGVKKTFYQDGTVQSETPYVDGEPHGLSKTYSQKGTVTRTCMLKNGQRDGELVDYWPRGGNKRRVVNYESGTVTGVVKKFYRNGQLKQAIPFVNDMMHGEEKRYTEEGEPEKSRYWWHGDMVTKTEFTVKSE